MSRAISNTIVVLFFFIRKDLALCKDVTLFLFFIIFILFLFFFLAEIPSVDRLTNVTLQTFTFLVLCLLNDYCPTDKL